MGKKYRRMENQKPGPGWARNQKFPKRGELEPKILKFSKNV